MFVRSRLVAACWAACLLLPTAAQARGDASGGASVPDRLELKGARCADGQAWSCPRGQQLTLEGDGLDGVRTVEFLGRRGHRDDRRATPVRRDAHSLVVVVPAGAHSGPLRARSVVSGTARAPRTVRVEPSAPAAVQLPQVADVSPDGVFPIDGRHDMGQSASNGFGGGRGHQGQDVFATCGTPLVAVRQATVQFAGSQSRAGNYLVLQDPTGRSYAYMHMRARALVSKGDQLVAGQRVGYVGDTGDAVGCHLHFELWTAPGWYSGGHPIDPLPQLKRWESAEAGRR